MPNQCTWFECECCIATTWSYSSSYVSEWKYSKCDVKAGAIIMRDNKILLVQSRGKKWGFPKGSVEMNESLCECASRELLEETSLNVSFSKDDDHVVIVKNTALFFKELASTVGCVLDYDMVKNNSSDCSGLGWMRLSCIKKYYKDPSFTSQIGYFVRKYM